MHPTTEYTATIEYIDGTTEAFDIPRYDVRLSPEEGFLLVLDEGGEATVLVLTVPREQVREVRVAEKP